MRNPTIAALLACSRYVSDLFDGTSGNAAFVFLMIDGTTAGDINFAPFRQEVDDG